MTSYRKREQGLTFITLSLIVVLIGFFTLLILKIGPIYMNHSKVMNALAVVENTIDVETKSKREIRDILEKRFDINYVDGVDLQDVEITKAHDNHLRVQIAYEVVKPIMGNLSVLVEFDDEIEVGEE